MSQKSCRFELPLLGRRRGWLVLTQLALAALLMAMAATSPSQATRAFALLAVAVAFLSASQDVVIDAYRTDLLPPGERGLGSSLNVLGYRLAMILSGGIALIWTDPAQGGGWSWPQVYRFMAGVMVVAAAVSALALPRLAGPGAPRTRAYQDLFGFFAVLAAVALGVLLTDRLAAPLAGWLLAPLWDGSAVAPALQGKWAELLASARAARAREYGGHRQRVWRAGCRSRFDPVCAGKGAVARERLRVLRAAW